MDYGSFACRSCGGPLRYGCAGMSCSTGIVPNRADTPAGLRPGIDCDGRPRLVPRAPRPRVVEVFRCSCGCGREEKRRPGEPYPDRLCLAGGILIYHRTLTR